MTPLELSRMRKIDSRDFRVATRSTLRHVNRQIVLTLIREHQPISRADLARRMHVARGALTAIVRALVAEGVVTERRAAGPQRGPGRRPTLLTLRTSGRVAVAIDVRPLRTTVALAEMDGRVLTREVFETPGSPDAFAEVLAERVARLLAEGEEAGRAECQGVGVVVPGMVDRRTGHILYAPRLGWRDVDLRGPVSARLGLPVYVEGAPVACAMARLWLAPGSLQGVQSFACVSVSDGVGVGLVMNGDAVRGDAHSAGEFGHVTLDRDGPPCACGRRGCWEAFACNAATVARWQAQAGEPAAAGAPAPTVEDVVRRALAGEPPAIAALEETAEHIGRGLAAVVSAFNPGRIFVGGEVTAAWSLLEAPIRRVLARETLTAATRLTPVVPDASPEEYRLLGAVALVTAPLFAAPAVA